jgi:cell division GTPase FtsZ
MSDTIDGLGLPELPIEEFEPAIHDLDEVKDESGGAKTFAFIGSGQGGGRLAKAFFDLGYKKTVAFNLASHDLELLGLPEKHKFLVDSEASGAGKDQEVSKAAFAKNRKEVYDKLREIVGENVDGFFICVGAAGGTGGGSVLELASVANDYMLDLEREPQVGFVVSLPTREEAKSPIVASNTEKVMKSLKEAIDKSYYSPLIVVDNNKIRKLYPMLTMSQFWPTINGTVAGLFHVFNVLSTQDSEYTSFDPVDYFNVITSKGAMLMGATSINNFDSPAEIGKAVKSNLEKTLLAEGMDLTTARVAACIVVGGSEIFDTVPGLMTNLEYAFSTVASMTGEATVHRGIYCDSGRKKLSVYTLIGGLDIP